MVFKEFVAIMTGATIVTEDSFYRNLLIKAHYTIAADSGVEVFLRLGLSPDTVIGDMDSISPNSLKKIRKMTVEISQHPVEKDKSDTELALDFAIAKGFSHIYILGGIGSRLDHTLANLYLLTYGQQHNCRVCLSNRHHEIQLLTSSTPITITGKPGDLVSLLAISEKLEGLTLRGLRWELDRACLQRGSSMGISNYLVGKKAQVSLEKGMAFVMRVQEA